MNWINTQNLLKSLLSLFRLQVQGNDQTFSYTNENDDELHFDAKYIEYRSEKS